jgi:hypothetical protein
VLRFVTSASRATINNNRFSRDRNADFIDVVEVQSGTGHLEGKFAVHLGVYIASLAKLLGAEKNGRRPKSYECQIRSRLSLLAYGEDRWFDYSNQESTTEAVSA